MSKKKFVFNLYVVGFKYEYLKFSSEMRSTIKNNNIIIVVVTPSKP